MLSPKAFRRFFTWFGPLSLVGLLYTIIVLFANQGKRIVRLSYNARISRLMLHEG